MKKSEVLPRFTAEAYAQDLTSHAYEHAMQLYREGRAPVSLTLFLLKASSQREILQLQKMTYEAELAKVKAIEIIDRRENDTDVKEVMDALRTYSGTKDD